jgi:hypothetical protein
MMIEYLGRAAVAQPWQPGTGDRNSVRRRAEEADLTADGSRPAGPLSRERGMGLTPDDHTPFGTRWPRPEGLDSGSLPYTLEN